MSVEPLASPFHGFKLARLVLRAGSVRLSALHARAGSRGFYEVSEFARCEEGGEHPVPEWGCTCGFHAVADQDDLWRLGWLTLDTALLDVELSGRVIEHEHGLRAEFQEVTSVRVADRCHHCGDPAELLGSRRPIGPIAPCCRRHARFQQVEFDQAREDLQDLLLVGEPSGQRAPVRAEALVLGVQVLPPLLIALIGVLCTLLTGHSTPAGVAGLLAGGWLTPGRALADRVLHGFELSAQEHRRLLAYRSGLVLLAAAGSWGIAALLGVAVGGVPGS